MAMSRDGLLGAVVEALAHQPEKTAPIVKIAAYIWQKYESDLRDAGDLFYTWQYDMRWAAQRLRDAGRLVYERREGRPVWRLIGEGR